MDRNKIYNLIERAKDRFDYTEAEKVAKVGGWRYHDTKEGQTISARDIEESVAISGNSCYFQYFENCEQGNPNKSISCSTGRVSFRIDFFNPESPQVTIAFGMIYWAS